MVLAFKNGARTRRIIVPKIFNSLPESFDTVASYKCLKNRIEKLIWLKKI